MKHLISLSVILFGSFVLACPPGTRICVPVQHNRVVVPAVVHHAAVVNVQTILVPVATYTARYESCDDNSSLKVELQGLKAEIKALREAIAAANITPPPLPPGTTPSNPPPSIQEFESKKSEFKYDEKLLVSGLTKCSNCHQPSNADKKGGGFLLFEADGKNKDFGKDSEKINAKITKAIENGSMPKGDIKLTKEEKAQLLDFYKPEEKDKP